MLNINSQDFIQDFINATNVNKAQMLQNILSDNSLDETEFLKISNFVLGLRYKMSSIDFANLLSEIIKINDFSIIKDAFFKKNFEYLITLKFHELSLEAQLIVFSKISNDPLYLFKYEKIDPIFYENLKNSNFEFLKKIGSKINILELNNKMINDPGVDEGFKNVFKEYLETIDDSTITSLYDFYIEKLNTIIESNRYFSGDTNLLVKDNNFINFFYSSHPRAVEFRNFFIDYIFNGLKQASYGMSYFLTEIFKSRTFSEEEVLNIIKKNNLGTEKSIFTTFEEIKNLFLTGKEIRKYFFEKLLLITDDFLNQPMDSYSIRMSNEMYGLLSNINSIASNYSKNIILENKENILNYFTQYFLKNISFETLKQFDLFLQKIIILSSILDDSIITDIVHLIKPYAKKNILNYLQNADINIFSDRSFLAKFICFDIITFQECKNSLKANPESEYIREEDLSEEDMAYRIISNFEQSNNSLIIFLKNFDNFKDFFTKLSYKKFDKSYEIGIPREFACNKLVKGVFNMINNNYHTKYKEEFKILLNFVKEYGDQFNHADLDLLKFDKNFVNFLKTNKDVEEIFDKKFNFGESKRKISEQYANTKIAKAIKIQEIEENINGKIAKKTFLTEESKEKILNQVNEYNTTYSLIVKNLQEAKEDQEEERPELFEVFQEKINLGNFLKEEYIKMIYHLSLKKDLYYLHNMIATFPWNLSDMEKQNLAQNLIILFLKRKNIDTIKLFESSFRNNYGAISLFEYLVNKLNVLGDDFKKLKLSFPNLINEIIDKSQDFTKFLKFLEKLFILLNESHNQNINQYLMYKALLNDSFSAALLPNIEFLISATALIKMNSLELDESNKNEIFNEIYFENIKNKIKNINEITEEKTKKKIIDESKFEENFDTLRKTLNIFLNNQKAQISSETKEKLKSLHSDFVMIENFKIMQDYISYAKIKDDKLYEFGLKLNDRIEFKVMKFLDPYAFKAGIDTNCCQRVGGAGAAAAIDSFINPLSSVLMCYIDNNLISQSYFHYVPKDNGLILDNVEHRDQNIVKYGITKNILSKIYLDYARQIRAKLNLKYVKCGGGETMNKINGSMFKNIPNYSEYGGPTNNPDPRHFEVEAEKIKSKYTDVKYGLLDLLSPNLSLEQLSYENIKQSNYSPRLLKFAIRAIKLNMALNQNDVFSKSLVRMLWLERQFN